MWRTDQTVPSLKTGGGGIQYVYLAKVACDDLRTFGHGAFGRSDHGEGLRGAQYGPTKNLVKQLVKNTWPLLKENAAENGFKMFLTMFDIFPAVKDLFSFLRDSILPLDQNPGFRQHALLVFNMTGDAVLEHVEKGSLDELRPILLELGRTHIGHGVVDAHFDLLKLAFLRTIEEALPELWSLELNLAWAEAYDNVANAVKDEMHGQALAQLYEIKDHLQDAWPGTWHR